MAQRLSLLVFADPHRGAARAGETAPAIAKELDIQFVTANKGEQLFKDDLPLRDALCRVQGHMVETKESKVDVHDHVF